MGTVGGKSAILFEVRSSSRQTCREWEVETSARRSVGDMIQTGAVGAKGWSGVKFEGGGGGAVGRILRFEGQIFECATETPFK